MGYRKRNIKENETPEAIPETIPEATPEIDDAEAKKIALANKRRETLAKARAMRTPKHEIRKQAEETIKTKDETIKSKDEIIKNKEQELGQTKQEIENNRIKMLEDNVIMMKKLLSDKAEPTPKPKRAYKPRTQPAPQPQQPAPQPQQPKPPSTNVLMEKSYTEQLQQRLQQQIIKNAMIETFGGF